jgi:hypothetical protein
VEVVSTQNDDAVVESSEDSSINSVDDYMTWMYGPPDKVKESSAAGEGNNDPEESKIRSVDDYMHWMFNRVW